MNEAKEQLDLFNDGGAMMHKNVEIRAKWENVENERQESKLEDEAGCIDGVMVGKEVLHMLCTPFLKTDRRKTRKTKDLAILIYFDLETRNHDGQKFIGKKSCKTTMKTKQEQI